MQSTIMLIQDHFYSLTLKEYQR